jgi:hypothetical protein
MPFVSNGVGVELSTYFSSVNSHKDTHEDR